MKTRINICAFISLAFLVMLTSNTSACWVKQSPVYDSGSAYTYASDSEYAVAYLSNSANAYGVHVSALTIVEPYLDASNDNLQAYTTLTGAYCGQSYLWDDESSPQPHTFNVTWYEGFDWDLEGNADNYGSGTGDASSHIEYCIFYSSYPYVSGMNDHYVEFSAYSDKIEDGSWTNLLELCWEPVDNDLDLEWDDSAYGSDNTYLDISGSGEHADNKSWSEDIYSYNLKSVFACVSIEGYAHSDGYNNADSALAHYHTHITDFDLSY